MHERTRPHRERATDGHRCEEQSGREFVSVSFHTCFPFGFDFSVVTFWATPFGRRVNVFLPGKAKTAVETRQIFLHPR
jgi:hypothetical protein